MHNVCKMIQNGFASNIYNLCLDIRSDYFQDVFDLPLHMARDQIEESLRNKMASIKVVYLLFKSYSTC